MGHIPRSWMYPLSASHANQLDLSTIYFVCNSNVPGIWWMISSCGVLQCVGRANAICSSIWELDSGHWRFCDGQQRCLKALPLVLIHVLGWWRWGCADFGYGWWRTKMNNEIVIATASLPSESWTVVIEGSLVGSIGAWRLRLSFSYWDKEDEDMCMRMMRPNISYHLFRQILGVGMCAQLQPIICSPLIIFISLLQRQILGLKLSFHLLRQIPGAESSNLECAPIHTQSSASQNSSPSFHPSKGRSFGTCAHPHPIICSPGAR